MAWSTRQKGNVRENKVIQELAAFGYFCFASRGSRGIDLVCIHVEDREAPYLTIEVGGESKVIKASFDALAEADKPQGTVAMVVRELKRKGKNFFRWHVHPDAFYDDVNAAMEFVREPA